MRRVLILLLAIVIFIPLGAVSVSATSFDLGSPYKLSYIDNISRTPQNFRYFNSYRIYDDGDELTYTGGSTGFDWFSYRLLNDVDHSTLWEIGSSNFYPSTTIYSEGVSKSNHLWIRDRNNRSNDLTFASFVYEGLILPVTGQYLKVTISFYSFQENIPSYYDYLLDPSYFCYLCDDYTGGTGDLYSLPKLSASTVSISNKGNNFYEYNYYFNYNGIDPSIFSSDNICLAVRIPFYFDENSIYNNGVSVYASATLPSSFEILTIGGYSQELDRIDASVVKGFEDLNNTLSEVDPGDTVIITDLSNQLGDLDNSMSDYDDALSPILTMKDNYTSPPMQSIVSQYTGSLDTSDVKSFFSLPWLVSAISLVFSFCIIRLLLYGTKEG